jgi:hypothetical protein
MSAQGFVSVSGVFIRTISFSIHAICFSLADSMIQVPSSKPSFLIGVVLLPYSPVSLSLFIRVCPASTARWVARVEHALWVDQSLFLKDNLDVHDFVVG